MPIISQYSHQLMGRNRYLKSRKQSSGHLNSIVPQQSRSRKLLGEDLARWTYFPWLVQLSSRWSSRQATYLQLCRRMRAPFHRNILSTYTRTRWSKHMRGRLKARRTQPSTHCRKPNSFLSRASPLKTSTLPRKKPGTKEIIQASTKAPSK